MSMAASQLLEKAEDIFGEIESLLRDWAMHDDEDFEEFDFLYRDSEEALRCLGKVNAMGDSNVMQAVDELKADALRVIPPSLMVHWIDLYEKIKAISNFKINAYPEMRLLGAELQVSAMDPGLCWASCELRYDGEWDAEVVLGDVLLPCVGGRTCRMSDIKACEMQLFGVLSCMPSLRRPPPCMRRMWELSIRTRSVSASTLAQRGDISFVKSAFSCSHLVHLRASIEPGGRPSRRFHFLDMEYIMSVYQLVCALADRYGVCTPFAEIFTMATMRDWGELIEPGLVVVHVGDGEVGVDVIW